MNSISVPYTTSTDINEIAQECEYILRVTPTESVVVSDWRGTETFTCSVEEKIKGEYEIPDSIDIPFFIGQVEIGDSYIVMVNRAGGASGDSIVFTLAAKDNTVLPSDSAAVQRIMDALPAE